MTRTTINMRIAIFSFSILILFIIACSSQGQTKLPAAKPEKDLGIQSNEIETDTTLRLRYTTGIRSILEDSKGNFWFGSHQEGLCLFDGQKLTYFTEKDGLSDRQVRSIFEDSNGRIWFECGVGLSSYDGKSLSAYTNKNYLLNHIWQAGENDLWFKGDESTGYNQLEGKPGVYRYDGHQLSYHVFPFSDKENDASYYSVSTPFSKGKNGRYWFGTYGAVIGYDGSSFTIIDSDMLGLNEETGYLHVRSILEDSKGNLWIGNNGIGVWLYDGETITHFSKDQGLISKNSLLSGGYRSPAGSLEHVFAIGEDSEGNIWFGDRDTGAWKYDGKSMKNYTTEDGLTTTFISHIYQTKDRGLWFAMGDGSVCRFNGKGFERIF